MNEHIPRLPATSHARQFEVHVVLQQVPSMQWPERHCESPVHVCPFERKHEPLPLQTIGAAQVPGSLAPVATFAQEPSIPGSAHVMHVPPHALEQQ